MPDGTEVATDMARVVVKPDLFLDPTYYFGIRLGGASQQAVWAENSPRRDLHHCELDLSG